MPRDLFEPSGAPSSAQGNGPRDLLAEAEAVKPGKGRNVPGDGAVFLNALAKGVAGVPDALLNTPNTLLNLGKAGYGFLATQLGRPDLAPELEKNPDLAHHLAQKIGLIRSNAEPVTEGQRMLDMAGQGMGGALVNPAGGLRQMAANAALGGSAGAVGGVVGEVSGMPMLGALAGMGALPMVAGAANTVQRGGRLIQGGQDARTGRILATAGDSSPAALAEQIRSGNVTLVPGAEPTTTQAAMNPGLSQLQRSAQSAGADFSTKEAQQNAARLAHLDTISPGAGGFTSIDAAGNAGNSVFRQASEQRNALKEAIGGAYNHPVLDNAAISFPDAVAVRAAIERRYPGAAYGTDGHNLTLLAKLVESGQPVPLKEFDALRKMAGNKAADLRDTDRTASAAAGDVKSLFDQAEAAAVAKSGGLLAPDQAEMIGNGRFLHKTLMDRYETGPAQGMWRTGPDGLPVKQGAEIAKGFYNGGTSQADDVARFWKMLPGNEEAANAMRQYAMADLLEKTTLNNGGLLSNNKLTGYTNTRSGALSGLLSDEQMGTLGAVQDDLARATQASGLNRVAGSDTAQKLLGAGMLESPWISKGASLIPKIGPAAVDWLKTVIRQQQAKKVGEALLDPAVAERALTSYQGLLSPTRFDDGARRVAPFMGLGLLGNLPQ